MLAIVIHAELMNFSLKGIVASGLQGENDYSSRRDFTLQQNRDMSSKI
jgi:hypothetical protein